MSLFESQRSDVLPGLSKVNMSPSHLAALLGVFGSELQLDLRRLFLFGEMGSSVEESKSARSTNIVIMIIVAAGATHACCFTLKSLTGRVLPLPAVAAQNGAWRGG